jgi:hypothetical protein
MAKNKATRKSKSAKVKHTKELAKRAVVKKASGKNRPAKKKSRSSLRGLEAASITSGTEASTLDPKAQLILESEEEATPGVHKGDLSGDLEGLSGTELYDSESVTELIEEGQDLEAELIEGIEEAPDPDQGEVRVHKAPQTAVPDYKNRKRI